MTYHHAGYDQPDEEHEEHNLMFILPKFVSAQGFFCAKGWTEKKIGFACGCPRCLRKHGLVLIFHTEDWNESGDCQEHWRKLIVSVKTANLVRHLIIPGYEPE